MSRRHLLLVFGTRPEAVKMAPLVHELAANRDLFSFQVCSTGQHREMLQPVLDAFGISPDFDLDVMTKGQDLYDLSSRILLGMRNVISTSSPDMVLVHGDTSTSTMAALSAFYAHIPVAHVEAGLRTYDIQSPWPEELNRQLTSRIASLHFAPTELARTNLLRENISPDAVCLTGNTVVDALHWVVQHGKSVPFPIATGRRMVLITCHRRENIASGINGICNAINVLATYFPDVDFVYPVHFNPAVRLQVGSVINTSLPNIRLIDPLNYFEFVGMMQASTIILTDSGGIQEEAPAFGKPVLVLRDTTERPEAISAGVARLVGTDTDCIVQSVSTLLSSSTAYSAMSHAINPFGDGHASRRIVESISNFFTSI